MVRKLVNASELVGRASGQTRNVIDSAQRITKADSLPSRQVGYSGFSPIADAWFREVQIRRSDTSSVRLGIARR